MLGWTNRRVFARIYAFWSTSAQITADVPAGDGYRTYELIFDVAVCGGTVAIGIESQPFDNGYYFIGPVTIERL